MTTTLQQAYDAAVAALIAHCPAKVGQTATVKRLCEEVAIHVERIRVNLDGAAATWSLQGKRLKKDGTPHATANEYGWLKIADELAKQPVAEVAAAPTLSLDAPVTAGLTRGWVELGHHVAWAFKVDGIPTKLHDSEPLYFNRIDAADDAARRHGFKVARDGTLTIA